MEAQIEFGVDSVYAIVKRKSFTAVDFLSFIGGLLGLFAGFSVISGFEIIYHFMIYPVIKMRTRNDSRIYPLSREITIITKKIQFLNYCSNLFKESSIHSFNHIGNQYKNLFER